MYYKRSNCRYCLSKKLKIILNLGKQPPSNSFIYKKEIKKEKKFPLRLFICRKCYLVQLLDVISGKKIFNKYNYLSSSSIALVIHFRNFANKIKKKFNIKSGDVVLDIGCNDGIMLDAYKKKDLIKIGVEPSYVAKIAKKKGYIIYKSFFNEDLADNIKKKYKKVKIITATNVFAHIDDMYSFLNGIKKILDNESIFIVEVSYLPDLINNNLFDTIYHEHLCYLSLTPLISFLKKFGLKVFDVEKHNIGASGPSVTFYIKNKASKLLIKKSVSKMLNYEKNWGINKLNKYYNFHKRIKSNKNKTIALIKEISKKGQELYGFGAPAKGNTLLNYYKLNSKIIKYISDNNKFKQGKYTPGSNIKIVSDNYINKKNFKYALLLSWNYKKYFLQNSTFIKNGGKFIVPLPHVSILPKC